MARSPREAKAALDFDVESVLLFQVSGSQMQPKDDGKDDDLFVNAEIGRIVDPDADHHFCMATFRCGRSGGGETQSRVAFKASYGILFSVREGSIEDAAKEAAATLAWSRFIDLFSITNGQMRTRMPPLPIRPDDVVLVADDDRTGGNKVVRGKAVRSKPPVRAQVRRTASKSKTQSGKS